MIEKIIDSFIPNSWSLIVFTLIIVITLRGAYLSKSSRKFVFHKELISLLFIIYILCLYYVVVKKNSLGINLIPLKDILKYKMGSKSFYTYIISNILVFIPFGFFTSYYLNSSKLSKSLVVSLIVTISIEIMQYYLYSLFSIDNILLRTIGCLSGYLIYIAINAIKSKLPDFMKKDWFINLFLIVIIILILIFWFDIDVFGIFD